MGLAYNIICYFAGCMYSKFVSSVLATTVGIPDMGNAEGRISVSHILIEEQWEIAPSFIHNYVV